MWRHYAHFRTIVSISQVDARIIREIVCINRVTIGDRHLRNKSEWVLAGTVSATLSWMALGHSGPDGVQKFALIPLTMMYQKIKCLITLDTCPYLQSVVLNLFFDILGNVIVFIPFGLVIARALQGYRHQLRRTVLLGLLLSLCFEIIQIWIPGRVVATDDVILNTLGTLIGGLIYLKYSRGSAKTGTASDVSN